MSDYGAEVILRDYLHKREQKFTEQRKFILDLFLKVREPLSIEELYDRIRKKHPRIGLATVYRTIKILCECGLAKGLKAGDGAFRYEFIYEFHSQLICIKCKRAVDFEDPQITGMQTELARRHHFMVMHSRLDIYGVCSECYKKKLIMENSNHKAPW